MNRITIVKQYVDNIIDNIVSEKERKDAIIHTYGVAQCCSLIANKRGLNSELAFISGLLHDIYAYFTGSYLCHGPSGAEMARPAIRDMKIFSDEEKKIILSAIFYHSDKIHVHDEYDELLKDADVLQSFLNASSCRIFYSNLPRLSKILNEFNIKTTPIEFGHDLGNEKETFKRSFLADIAEDLAAKKINGEKENITFAKIIQYYPEVFAFDELKSGWCAAFVYYCVLKAGMELPIKQPPIKSRFAGVGAWYEWGKDNGFIFSEKDKIKPCRGDIVIYNNIIHKENKTKDSLWHDHIGIILSCDKDDFLIVAEGNIDNKNVSGIIKRRRDNTIGCYLRIPDGYQYEGWKCDYKASMIYML